jgi:hypothetical protein
MGRITKDDLPPWEAIVMVAPAGRTGAFNCHGRACPSHPDQKEPGALHIEITGTSPVMTHVE